MSNNTYNYINIVLFLNQLPKWYKYNLVTNIVIHGYIYQISENHKIIILILFYFSSAQHPYGQHILNILAGLPVLFETPE